IEHGPAAEAFPQNPHIAARNRDQDVGSEDDAHQGRHHQIDHDDRKVPLRKTPPERRPTLHRGVVPEGDDLSIHCPICTQAARRNGFLPSTYGLVNISLFLHLPTTSNRSFSGLYAAALRTPPG